MIDITKAYTTRDGRPVRIYATDGSGTFCVHGAWMTESGQWAYCSWDRLGHLSDGKHPRDLIEVKPKRTYSAWVTVFKDGSSYATYDESEAKEISGAIARFHIVREYAEGEGLP